MSPSMGPRFHLRKLKKPLKIKDTMSSKSAICTLFFSIKYTPIGYR
jgi:hypothetical protein